MYSGKHARDDSDSEDGYTGGHSKRRRTDTSGGYTGGRVRIDSGARQMARYDPPSDDDDDEDRVHEVKRGREPLTFRGDFQGSIKSYGRGQVRHTQAMVVYTSRVDPDRYTRLKEGVRDKEMLVPGSLDSGAGERAFKNMPGNLMFRNVNARGTGRSLNNTGYSSSDVFSSMNGVKTTDKLVFVGLLAGTDTDPSKKHSDDAVPIELRGATTTVNTGPTEIKDGQDIIADPLPVFVSDSAGMPVSGIEWEGEPIQKLMAALYPVRQSDTDADLSRVRAMVDGHVADGLQDDPLIQKVWDVLAQEDAMYGSTQSLRHYGIYYAALLDSVDGNRLVRDAIANDLDDRDAKAYETVFGAAAGTPDDELYGQNQDGKVRKSLLVRCMQRAVDQFRDRIRRLYVGKCIGSGVPGAPIDIMMQACGMGA